jgi:integral membrane protein (TIGR01906 family)
MTRRWETAVVVVALLLAGLVGLALLFAQPVFYEGIARAFAPVVWHSPLGDGTVTGRGSLSELVGLHASWLGYVTGFGNGPGVLLFTADEWRHMADVRTVFIAMEIAAVSALAALAVIGRVVARRGVGAIAALARDASVIAAVAVAILGVAAAFAFDSLFLMFHELFFPQGNFLFPPDSNLIAMYPDQYWYETTIRIGAAFVLTMAVIALGSAATLRRARR